MPPTECRFQKNLKPEDAAAALEADRCHNCSITLGELLKDGKFLEICGEEYISDLTTGQDYSVAIALCPDCHRQAHLDAGGNHSPCHVNARRSREWIDWPEKEADRLAAHERSG
ncbi:MAG: hypothetical protein AAGK37_00440 [Pseudomonadota bacterium]